MQPAYLSYAFLGSFLTATGLLQWWQLPFYPSWVFSFLGVFGLLGLFGLFFHRTRPIASTLLAISLSITIAFANVARTTHVPSALTVDTYAHGENVEILGTIVAEPDRRPLQTKYTIDAEEIRFLKTGTILHPIEGNILATDGSGWPRYSYGDRVLARGKLEQPGVIDDFHYDHYLSRSDIYSFISRASMHSIAEGKPRSLFRTLFALKEGFEGHINTLYSEPHASFMAGLLTGSRRGIPETLLADFNTVGLTHIIAISGYNITIVVSIFSTCLFWIPLRWRFIPSVLAIALFTLFVGASAAVVRAAIMGTLGLLALHIGRQSTSRLTILWTCMMMVLLNPKYLWYDAGFQLSFLAVVGLMEVSPFLDRWFVWVPSVFGIRESLQMTVAAQISTAPLTMLLFGRVSLIAPLANILVAPLIPFAMLFGFLGTLLSGLWFPLGQIVAYLGWGCLTWIIFIAQHIAHIPFASLETQVTGKTLLIGSYAFIVSTIAWATYRSTIRTNEAFVSIQAKEHPALARVSSPGRRMHTK